VDAKKIIGHLVISELGNGIRYTLNIWAYSSAWSAKNSVWSKSSTWSELQI